MAKTDRALRSLQQREADEHDEWVTDGLTGCIDELCEERNLPLPSEGSFDPQYSHGGIGLRSLLAETKRSGRIWWP